jgi:ribonuclease HII
LDISKLTIEQLKKKAGSPIGDNCEFRRALSEDSRAGARELHEKLLRAENDLALELQRLARMFLYEEELIARGYHLVAGVDEAGRGPLAGPVVAAAVILTDRENLLGLDDSKKLTAARREILAGQIKKVALAWYVGSSSVDEIFIDNIHQAGLKAMRRAVKGLALKPAYLLVDGFKIDRLDYPQTPIINGDSLSASIAAASILAKVTRDQMMDSYHTLYPQYGFDRHKGYGTKEHLEALSAYGPCPIHRAGFRPIQERLMI